MLRRAEVAVIGLGAMGANALWRLASRGVDVIGFERFSPGHSMGSSHGESRIFRTAYLEHPAYVPLAKAALTLWRDLERETGEDLLRLNGGLMIGPATSQTVRGAQLSAEIHHLEYDVIDSMAFENRHPQHVLDAGDMAIYEPLAGYLRPERAIRAAARRAMELGAELRDSTDVLELRGESQGTRIITSEGEWFARRLVLCAGSWIPKLVPTSALPLTVERVVMVWHRAKDATDFAPDRCPIWIHELGDGSVCYGFPSLDGRTVKLASHHRGKIVDPDAVDREVRQEDIAHVEAFVRNRLKGLDLEPIDARVCMYTNTPDWHFAIGELPGREEIVLVSACSGHGFKFATVIGELAAQLALDRATGIDLSLFDVGRLAGLAHL